MCNITVKAARGPAHRGRGGFTLVEVAVATAIIGLGVSALLTTIAAGTRSNAAGQKLTQATFLAQEIREWALRQDFNALAGAIYSPPHDGEGNTISGMTGWSHAVTVTWKNPSNLAATGVVGPTDMVYVQVVVSYKSQPVLTTGWLVSRRQ